jgi:hypothetical protein
MIRKCVVVTQLFILFFKNNLKKITKNQKNSKKTIKTKKNYVLNVFTSFLTSFPKNLRLKKSTFDMFNFNALILKLLIKSSHRIDIDDAFFFKNQNTKKNMDNEIKSARKKNDRLK